MWRDWGFADRLFWESVQKKRHVQNVMAEGFSQSQYV